MSAAADVYRAELAAVRVQLDWAREDLAEVDGLLGQVRRVTADNKMNTSQ